MIPELGTSRLVLRDWRDDDCAAFAALNADPRVMEYLPSVLTREESDAMVGRIRNHIAEHGYGLWVVEVPGVSPFIGFVGLVYQTFDAPFTPAVEIGWRLAFDAWGHGYAREGARAALDFAFDSLHAVEVVSMTVPGNVRSKRVMEAIGMSRDPADDFDHPRLAESHPLRRHVLYRVRRPT